MAENAAWRIEKYQDEIDPFVNIQWYVMQGNVVIATCEVEAHAEAIVAMQVRHLAYEQVLQRITAMSAATHDLEAAIDAAFRALDSASEG